MDAGDDFDWRPIEATDAKSWAALLGDIQAVDQDWSYFTEQDLLEDFDDPDRDFRRGSVAVRDGAAMVAFGALHTSGVADPVHEIRFDGGVHPDYRRRGLGGRLLDWAEAKAVLLHQDRHPGRPLSLSGWCLSSLPDAVELYARRGYEPVRWFHAMLRTLDSALPEVAVPAGVQIVGYTAERIDDALLVRNEAFSDHWNAPEVSPESWAHFMGYSVFRPSYSFLAYADGEPLGVLISHEYDAYLATTGIRDIYIAVVGTRRAARKRGIATALLSQAMSAAQEAGFGTASLVVDADSLTGALGLYERAGFAVEHTAITQTKGLLEAPR